MRYAILVARLHGQSDLKASEAGDPGKLNAEFKSLVATPPPELAELHLLISDQGIVKRKKFDDLRNSTPPQPAAATDETHDNSAAAAPAEEVPSSPEPTADESPAPAPGTVEESDPQPKRRR